jgi:ribosome-binding protein aMBF1 (putative translation factor)
MAPKTSSPLGSAHSEGMRKRAQKSAAYKAALEKQKPFEEFARLVIGKRMQLGLTQQELAERMGTSHSVISRMESGQHRVSFATMTKVAKALDTRLVYGFEDEVAKKTTKKKVRRAPKRDLVVAA